MNNKEFGKKLEERTLNFALSILKFSASIPFSSETNVIKTQLTKSGTSIGANYREANRSMSKADFKHKISICSKEANETVYWLQIVHSMEMEGVSKEDDLLKEANEILAIFTSISHKIYYR